MDTRVTNAVDTQHTIEHEPSITLQRSRCWRITTTHHTVHGMPYQLDRIVWSATKPNIPNTMTQEVTK